MLCRSGQSIFSRPKPIDINSARGGFVDLEMEDEDEEQAQPLVRGAVVFDASHERTPEQPNGYTPMPLAGQARSTEDLWAELG